MEKLVPNSEKQNERLNYLIKILLSEINDQIQMSEDINEKHFIYKS